MPTCTTEATSGLKMQSGKIRSLDSLSVRDLEGKRVVLRLDLNLPEISSGAYDLTRLDLAMSTVRFLSSRGAKTIILSHFGRPKGKVDQALSLKPVFNFVRIKIMEETKKNVIFSDINSIPDIADGAICICENIRFYRGEEENSPTFARFLAQKGDLYVNEAFSSSHSTHASVDALARVLPSWGGFNLIRELSMLEKLLSVPRKPLIAAVGGNKLDTKIEPIQSLIGKLSTIMICGVLGNTFIKASGGNIGRSMYESGQLGTARSVMQACKDASCRVILPEDAIVNDGVSSRVSRIESIGSGEEILDIGHGTLLQLKKVLDCGGTLVWNGPLGMVNKAEFAQGTLQFARAVAEKTDQGRLISVVGGGDTVSVLTQINATDKLTYVSSGGGAFLAWLSGKMLPGIEVLMDHD